MCSLAVHGKGSYKYDNVRIGYNSRLDTIQAAILLEKLKAFQNYELKDRNDIAKHYTDRLGSAFVTPLVPDGFGSSWAQFTLILNGEAERNVIQEKLKAKGIPTMVYYPKSMHEQTAFADLPDRSEKLAVSTRLSKSVLSIPMHPYLTTEDVDFIADALLECKNR